MNRNKNPRMVYKQFSVHSPLVETATENNLITGISCLVTCHANYVLMQLWQISNLLSQTVNVTFQSQISAQYLPSVITECLLPR